MLTLQPLQKKEKSCVFRDIDFLGGTIERLLLDDNNYCVSSRNWFFPIRGLVSQLLGHHETRGSLTYNNALQAVQGIH